MSKLNNLNEPREDLKYCYEGNCYEDSDCEGCIYFNANLEYCEYTDYEYETHTYENCDLCGEDCTRCL